MDDPHSGTQSVRDVRVAVEPGVLEGNLAIPHAAGGLVVFAHGSGSSRFSPRNQYVARHLQAAGLATLLIDLLTASEDEVDQRTERLRFDFALLGKRLIAILDRQAEDPEIEIVRLPVGVFGASTGAAAALVAAAQRPAIVQAVVSRGGRPDLAQHLLGQVRSPTLLIVGERDVEVLNLNRQALSLLHTAKELAVVPGATHLFEEPGALERVADLAVDWFARYLHT